MHTRAVGTLATALAAASALFLPVSQTRAADAQRPQPVVVAQRPQPVIVAHRGASSHAPENTLPAVDRAAALGFSWVENDVQRTKDGELVVVHDTTLKRTTNVERIFPGRAPWKVKDFTAAEIARLDAGSWFSLAFAGTRVPTLDQYLRRIEHNHEKLLLEIKNPELYPGIEAQTLKVLANDGWLDHRHLADRLIVQSFSADSVRAVHRLKPAVRTAYLGRPDTAELRRYATFVDLINPSYPTLSADYVAAAHAHRGPHGAPLRVFAWTVDDASGARTVAGYGVDGVITNKPDVVRAVLKTV
ncbi:glycerophosphodiester phosphodiesterase [Streptomyces sp. NPDC052043]|uniref:glycerophosphodiester phosphodiesterase n=1 Tax=Streptomyces sp. NPDC052043 TaxID=3365684 RepID=UPI0037D54CC5